MEAHTLKIYGKVVNWTEKSMFRVEERKQPKGSYEGLFAHKDIHKAINYYLNTPIKKDYMIRLVKDGDEFLVIQKQAWGK